MDYASVFLIGLSTFTVGILVGGAMMWNSAMKVAAELIEEAAKKAEAEAVS